MKAHIDFETRGTLDLRAVGLHRYSKHPETSPWCMAWAIGDDEPKLWTPDEPLPAVLARWVEAGHPVVAHNAPFELAIWNEICVSRYGFPVLQPAQTYCTMALSYAMSLPGALEDASRAVGLKVQKDAEGRALMLRMAKPRSKDPLVWWDDDERKQRLYQYCKQDVVVERELEKRLLPLSDYERQVWLADYGINQRGVMIDRPTALAGIELAERVKEVCNAELAAITDNEVQTATALIPFKEWLGKKGYPVESLDKGAVIDLLADDNLEADVRRALEIRQEAGKASTAKLKPMILIAGDDDRARNTTQYHGAGTGRWAGRKVQPHNFPRDVPEGEVVEQILALVRAGDLESIDMLFGPPMKMLSQCLRGFFVAAPGNVLIPGDFNNVEGRGTAWFSGEQWKVKAFLEADAGTGPGLYELAYAKAFNYPVAKIKNPSIERQIGKVLELLLGFGGSVGAIRRDKNSVKLTRQRTDKELKQWVDGWRASHKQVVKTWYQLEEAAITAVQRPGGVYKAGFPGRQVSYKKSGSFLWCMLPSRRVICYPYPKILPGKFGDQLTYMAVPGQDKSGIIKDPMNGNNWARFSTYGGSLMENVVQAMCRDLLVHCLMQLKDNVVLHVHDELVIEVPEKDAKGARENMERIMRSPPKWADGFPLKAECKIMRRYGK